MTINSKISKVQRYLSGDITPEEKKEFELWINDSEENRLFFESVEKIWSVTPDDIISVDTEEAWLKLESRLMKKSDYLANVEAKAAAALTYQRHAEAGISTVRRPVQLRRRESSLKLFLRVAAVLIVGAAMGVSSYMVYTTVLQKNLLEEQNTWELSVIYEANHGEVKEITLADGTQVVLNSGSRLETLPGYLEGSFMVSLQGEAFFSVVNRKDRVFGVITNEAIVEVLGTKFNVSSWKELNTTEVVVESGLVGVSGLDINRDRVDQRLVSGNQRVVVRHGEVPSLAQSVDYGIHMLWLNGGMNFDDAPLSHVFQYLERRFNVTIEVQQEDIMHRKVNARYVEESLQEILEITTITHDLDFRMDGDKIVVEPLFW